MPQETQSPLAATSFLAMSRVYRDQELQQRRTLASVALTPDGSFFNALNAERATRRLERSREEKGEGPPISFGSTSLRTLIEDNRSLALELLERYYPVYCASFPDPDERLPLGTILSLVEDRRFSIDLDILTAGRRIIGGYQTHVTKIDGDAVSLGDYLCVDHRMKGLGVASLVYRTTISDRMNQWGALAHFGEINDPRLMDNHQRAVDRKSGTDPEARLRFWSKQGRRVVDIPWLQPATAEGLAPVDYTMLTVHHVDLSRPLRITGETVQKVWDAYYLPLMQSAPILETRKEMRRLLEPYQGREVQLKPLTEPRSFLGGEPPRAASSF